MFCVIDGCFFLFKRDERLLNAGWQSKETISEIYFFRWQKKKIEKEKCIMVVLSDYKK